MKQAASLYDKELPTASKEFKISLRSTGLEEMPHVNNSFQVSTEMCTSLIKPLDETPAQADTISTAL